jgi:hypothetical protein
MGAHGNQGEGKLKAGENMAISPGLTLLFRKGLAGLCLLGLLAAGFNPAAAGQPLKPGTEVFAVAPENVVQISYRTATFWFVAYRWQEGDRFTLIFLKKGTPLPESCLAGEGFQTVLRQLTSLKLSQTPTADQTEELFRSQPRSTWAELVIRDDSSLEPFRALVHPAADSSGEVWLHFQGATYRVGLDHQVLELISGGCQILGAGRPQLD